MCEHQALSCGCRIPGNMSAKERRTEAQGFAQAHLNRQRAQKGHGRVQDHQPFSADAPTMSTRATSETGLGMQCAGDQGAI